MSRTAARAPTPESRKYRQDQRAQKAHVVEAGREFKKLLKLLQPYADNAKVEHPGRDQQSRSRRARAFVKAVKNLPLMTEYLDAFVGTEVQHPKARSWRSTVIYQARDVLTLGKSIRDALVEVDKQSFKGFQAIEMAGDQAPLREAIPVELRDFLPDNIVVEVDESGTIGRITDRFENEYETLGVKIDKMHALVRDYNRIAAQVKRDLKSGDEVVKLSALITAIMMETGIRPGKEGNKATIRVNGEKVEIETFGAVTLGPAHVKFVRDNFVELEFHGKKGGRNFATISDGEIIKLLRAYTDKNKGSKYIMVTSRGQRVEYKDLDRYFQHRFKDVSPTDFRKLKATEKILEALREEQVALYQRIHGFKETAKTDLRSRIVSAVVETLNRAIDVAQVALSHDKSTTTRKSYINPEIVLGFLSTGHVEDTLEKAILQGRPTLSFDPEVFVSRAQGKVGSTMPKSGLSLQDLLDSLEDELDEAGIKTGSRRVAERHARNLLLPQRVAYRHLKRAESFEEAVKGRKFNNPDTGNKVEFSSLPPEEQKKLRKEFHESKDSGDKGSGGRGKDHPNHDQHRAELQKALKDFVSQHDRIDIDEDHTVEDEIDQTIDEVHEVIGKNKASLDKGDFAKLVAEVKKKWEDEDWDLVKDDLVPVMHKMTDPPKMKPAKESASVGKALRIPKDKGKLTLSGMEGAAACEDLVGMKPLSYFREDTIGDLCLNGMSVGDAMRHNLTEALKITARTKDSEKRAKETKKVLADFGEAAKRLDMKWTGVVGTRITQIVDGWAKRASVRLAQTFDEAVKGRKFNNPDTGNKVEFGSLPGPEQKKLRKEFNKAQDKKKEENGGHHPEHMKAAGVPKGTKLPESTAAAIKTEEGQKAIATVTTKEGNKTLAQKILSHANPVNIVKKLASSTVREVRNVSINTPTILMDCIKEGRAPSKEKRKWPKGCDEEGSATKCSVGEASERDILYGSAVYAGGVAVATGIGLSTGGIATAGGFAMVGGKAFLNSLTLHIGIGAYSAAADTNLLHAEVGQDVATVAGGSMADAVSNFGTGVIPGLGSLMEAVVGVGQKAMGLMAAEDFETILQDEEMIRLASEGDGGKVHERFIQHVVQYAHDKFDKGLSPDEIKSILEHKG